MLQKLHQGIVAGIALQHILNVCHELRRRKSVVEIDSNQFGHSKALLDDGRHNEEGCKSKYCKYDEQGNSNTQDTIFQAAFNLQKTDKRIDHVSHDPSDEEWQQYLGKAIDEQYKSYCYERCNKPSYNAIEGYLFL